MYKYFFLFSLIATAAFALKIYDDSNAQKEKQVVFRLEEETFATGLLMDGMEIIGPIDEIYTAVRKVIEFNDAEFDRKTLRSITYSVVIMRHWYGNDESNWSDSMPLSSYWVSALIAKHNSLDENGVVAGIMRNHCYP